MYYSCIYYIGEKQTNLIFDSFCDDCHDVVEHTTLHQLENPIDFNYDWCWNFPYLSTKHLKWCTWQYIELLFIQLYLFEMFIGQCRQSISFNISLASVVRVVSLKNKSHRHKRELYPSV